MIFCSLWSFWSNCCWSFWVYARQIYQNAVILRCNRFFSQIIYYQLMPLPCKRKVLYLNYSIIKTPFLIKQRVWNVQHDVRRVYIRLTEYYWWSKVLISFTYRETSSISAKKIMIKYFQGKFFIQKLELPSTFLSLSLKKEKATPKKISYISQNGAVLLQD